MRFFQLLQEGGPVFTYPIFIILIISILLIIKALIKGDVNQKTQQLVHSISLFALVWGFLGFMLGLISALDTLTSVSGDMHPEVLGTGIKIGLLSPTFGMVTFLIARLGIILLLLKKK